MFLLVTLAAYSFSLSERILQMSYTYYTFNFWFISSKYFSNESGGVHVK